MKKSFLIMRKYLKFLQGDHSKMGQPENGLLIENPKKFSKYQWNLVNASTSWEVNFPQFHQKTSHCSDNMLTTISNIFCILMNIYFSWEWDCQVESALILRRCLQWINNLRLGKNLPWGVVMGWYKVGRDISSSRVKLFITITSLT